MDACQELELIKAAQAGDEDAKTRLVNAVYPLALKVITERCRDYAEPEDIESAAWLACVEAYTKHNGENRLSTVAHWEAMTQARYIVKASQTKKNGIHESEISYSDSDNDYATPIETATPDNILIRDEEKRAASEIIESALASLPEKLQSIMRDRQQGQTQSQIAERLGITRQAVCQHETKAKRLMREHCEANTLLCITNLF